MTQPTLGTARMTVIDKGKIDNLAVIAKESDHASMSGSVGSLSFLGQLKIQNIGKHIGRTALRALGNGPNVPDFDSWN